MTEWQNWEEVNAAIAGEYGEELRAEAVAVTENYWAEQQQAENQQWEQQFARESEQLEKRLNRELNTKEIDALVNDQYGTGRDLDLTEAYDRINGRDMSNPDDRRAYAGEIYDELEAEKESEGMGAE